MLSRATLAIGASIILISAAGLWVLDRSGAGKKAPAGVTSEARAYLPQLELSSITLVASESFANQRVVEVQGRIRNHGARPVRQVDVYCLFFSPTGELVHRERASIISSSSVRLQPDGERSFRLPFDQLPTSWNQAVPRMVIAAIEFAP